MAKGEFDERVCALIALGQTGAAATMVVRELGPEIRGSLSAVLGVSDADEVFSGWSVRLWRSLAGFEGRCSIRTWSHVLARREIARFRKGMRRHAEGRVPISELQDVLEVTRSSAGASSATAERRRLMALRDELRLEDRTLLILRVDRNLAWDEIAVAFAEAPGAFNQEDRKRESARLRKRFQLVKRRLIARARARDPISRAGGARSGPPQPGA